MTKVALQARHKHLVYNILEWGKYEDHIGWNIHDADFKLQRTV